jgi:hypothetical protein
MTPKEWRISIIVLSVLLGALVGTGLFHMVQP